MVVCRDVHFGGVWYYVGGGCVCVLVGLAASLWYIHRLRRDEGDGVLGIHVHNGVVDVEWRTWRVARK